MLELLSQPETYVSLATLTLLEVVLGIDNILLISILSSRLPIEKRDTARRIGLSVALISRLVLLSMVSYIAGLTEPLTEVGEWEVTGESLLLLVGGLFLIWKATTEIHEKIDMGAEHEHEPTKTKTKTTTLAKVVWQIMLLDVIFSLDSVVTAVGMARAIPIMVAANIIALAVMLLASKGISEFVEKYPSVKILALSFLLTVGCVLVAEAFEFHIPKGYIYFAMGFSLVVELLNIKIDQVARERTMAQKTDQIDPMSSI